MKVTKFQSRPKPKPDPTPAIVDAHDELIAKLIEQVVEQNLKIRYIMETIKFKKAALIVGAPDIEKTLYALYTSGDRERFLMELARRESTVHSQAADGDRTTTGVANGATAVTDTDGHPGAPAVETSILPDRFVG